jgi:hypothetical protein
MHACVVYSSRAPASSKLVAWLDETGDFGSPQDLEKVGTRSRFPHTLAG